MTLNFITFHLFFGLTKKAIKICNKEENFVSLKKIKFSIVYGKGLDLNIGYMVTIVLYSHF